MKIYSAKELMSSVPPTAKLVVLGVLGMPKLLEQEYVTIMTVAAITPLVIEASAKLEISDTLEVYAVVIHVIEFYKLLHEQLADKNVYLDTLYDVVSSPDSWRTTRGNVYPFIYLGLVNPINEEIQEPLELYQSISEELDPITKLKLAIASPKEKARILKHATAKVRLLQCVNGNIREVELELAKNGKPLYTSLRFDLHGNSAMQNIKFTK